MKRFAIAVATLMTLVPATASAYGKKLPTTPVTGDLKYFGGRVISNVKIVEVAWGSTVDSTYMTQLQGFYSAIVVSPFIDWLTEYDTIGLVGFADLQPGSNQHIGRGSVVGNFVITPTNKSTTLADSDIAAELVAQLNAATLPAPELDKGGNVDSLYMFDFPSGVSITLLNLQSCSSFGAYHGTVTYKGMSVPYGVHPNCGYSFNTSTLIHSHELIEAITDTEVGIVETNMTVPNERPLAWDTLASTAWASLEIADICEGTSATVATYTVQKIWSNYAQACVAEIPICDGVLVPPACRPCNTYDSGNACNGTAPACATTGKKNGQCVTCTSAASTLCTGATPACDDATYTCVPCVKNSDCTTMAAPICDQTTNMCRGCTADSECTMSVCDVASDATKGQCVACNTDQQCKETEMCTAHACVPKPMMPEAGPEVGDMEPVTTSGGGCGCDVVGGSPVRGAFAAIGLALIAIRRKRRGVV